MLELWDNVLEDVPERVSVSDEDKVCVNVCTWDILPTGEFVCEVDDVDVMDRVPVLL